MGQRDGDVSEFGHYLLARIADRGSRSPTSFAREAGIEPSIVHRWIAGKVVPTPETLRRAAPVLKVPFAELLGVALAMPAGPDVEVPHPLAAEITRMLAADSPLPVGERDLLVVLLDRVVAPVRPLMRRGPDTAG